ncbi:uncharacterized protein LOC141532102 isoform X1 [Cotesia typhae]|uniref:uncharacterized protein LOC141532102 isoform X1 n=2 Tax=Cotesia typhae TaxID=2053667 RepID=UPI003D698C98
MSVITFFFYLHNSAKIHLCTYIFQSISEIRLNNVFFPLTKKYVESLVKVYKKRDYVDFNPDLIYDRIHYKCSTRAKHDEDMPDNCESRLILSTSPHKQNLVVDDFVSEHNHPPIVIGRRGSTKQRQLLFEAAVELRETMRKRSQQTRRTVLPRNPENNIVNRKAIMKEAVIRLSRIDPHHTVDRFH